ncbi:MAG: ferritin family protein [Candidatus Brocadiaceae bacterium]|nr:ferritin family protein [Candidatus Brocadiaceae bacterium]
MDIFEFALQMEKDGEKYYRDLVLKVDNIGLKNVLSMLADAEVKHYEILQRLKENETVQISDVSVLSDVKNIFTKMKEEKDISGLDSSLREVYENALEIEKKSQEFYKEKAEEVHEQSQREILLKIAEEEKHHCIILENIINFVSQPARWLENAEWYHMDEY